MRRLGFTLVEIMVSIMIFTVVGGAMLLILLTATDLYRFGEAGRAATDEATVAIAALDDDLRRMVPAADGGWLHVEFAQEEEPRNGNILLAMKILPADPSAMTDAGAGARQLVAWYVDEEERLRRFTMAAPIPDNDPWTPDDAKALRGFPRGDGRVIADGCLHFSAWLAKATGTARIATDEEQTWEGPGIDPLLEVEPYDTGPDEDTKSAGQPFPHSMRILVALGGGKEPGKDAGRNAGSRFAQRGFVIQTVAASADRVRIAGVRSVPTLPGSLVRIGDEWVSYDGWSDGTLTGVRRGARRSTAVGHDPAQAPVPVRFATTYALVRALPR